MSRYNLRGENTSGRGRSSRYNDDENERGSRRNSGRNNGRNSRYNDDEDRGRSSRGGRNREYYAVKETREGKQLGFNLSDKDIAYLCELSEDVVTGKRPYDEVKEILIDQFSKNFYYREGNQRMVLVSNNDDYVIKLAKLTGWESIDNNANEFKNCELYYTETDLVKEHYLPLPIAQYGNDKYKSLVVVFERFDEIMESIAVHVKRNGNIKARQEELETRMQTSLIDKGYSYIEQMLADLEKYYILDDTGLAYAGANYGFNSKGGWAINDIGNFFWKGKIEPRCPDCGAPMVFKMESHSALMVHSSMKATSIRPKYVCLATINEQTGRHDFSTEEVLQEIMNNNDDYIMTHKEAKEVLQEIKEESISNEYVTHKGEKLYVASKSSVYGKEEVWKLFDRKGKFTGLAIDKRNDVFKMD